MTSTTRRILLLALLAMGLLAGLTSAAQAKTTTWSTINVAAPGAGEAGLFLSTGPGDRVVLERYVSGAPHQQWTPVYPQWPGAPVTTSDSPLDGLGGFLACIKHLACPFSVSISNPPRKFVNRLTGRCLTLDNEGGTVLATIERCRWQGSAMKEQVIEWAFPDAQTRGGVAPRTETALVRSRKSGFGCLTVEGPANTRMTGLRVLPCTSPSPWHQRFRFLQVASVTCTPGTAFGICGLPAGWKATTA
jgi:hypothetical protein